MHQLAETETKQTNKQKKKTNQQNPEPSPSPLTQLKGSWNSSAVKKAQEKG